MHCERCGHTSPEGSKFCSECGNRLNVDLVGDATTIIPVLSGDDLTPGALSDEDAAAVEQLPQGNALLIVTRGPDVGARYLLDAAETTAGRHPDSDIFLDDITVSRHHAKFVVADGVMRVEDLGSLNGTYVNRALIEGSAVLRPGDEVQIGKFRMVFFVSEHGLN